MSDILWIAAMVYHNGIGGTGDIRSVCDVVHRSGGNMYGSGVKKTAADREVKERRKIKNILSINETGGNVKCIVAMNADMNLRCLKDITNTIQRA